MSIVVHGMVAIVMDLTQHGVPERMDVNNLQMR
jgi:hypothetical protein